MGRLGLGGDFDTARHTELLVERGERPAGDGLAGDALDERTSHLLLTVALSVTAAESQAGLHLHQPRFEELEDAVSAEGEVGEGVGVRFVDVVVLGDSVMLVKFDAGSFGAVDGGHGDDGAGDGDLGDLEEAALVQSFGDIEAHLERDVAVPIALCLGMRPSFCSDPISRHESIPGGAIGDGAAFAEDALGLGVLVAQLHVHVLQGEVPGVGVIVF